jgi:hypothetical protein
MRALLSILLTFTLCFAAHSQTANDVAPFGLSWGMSKADAERIGVTLTSSTENGFGKSFSAQNLPRVLQDTEAVMLSFGHDDRLWRVAAASRVWSNDSYGTQASPRYDELVKLLTERYCPGKLIAQVPRNTFYSKPENFAYSIHMNERVQAVNWQMGGVRVQLSLRAARLQDLYYLLIYESVSLADAFRKAQRGREKEAL